MCTVQIAFAQNLVVNPSFENFTGCPQFIGQINLATGWNSFEGSPDYFNICANGVTPQFGMPGNAFGNQQTVQGIAYAGFVPYAANQPNSREYIGGQLTQQLIIGQKYFISFYVSLADTFSADCAINRIGLKFSTVSFSTLSPPPRNDSAHIHTDAIITDKINWTKISGSFVADSAYNYVLIGNFYTDANTDTVNCAAFSYYYTDMVCVSTDSLTCLASTGISENIKSDTFSLNPNPANDFLNVSSTQNEINEIEIYSSLGCLISKTFPKKNRNIKLKISNISNGIYFVKTLGNNAYSIHKIQIIH